MPARVTMRWPNGGRALSATTGGRTRTISQKNDGRMSGPPADGFAEQALRPERQHGQHRDIECSRRPGIAEPGRDEGLEDADAQSPQERARYAAPAAQRHGDVGL